MRRRRFILPPPFRQPGRVLGPGLGRRILKRAMAAYMGLVTLGGSGGFSIALMHDFLTEVPYALRLRGTPGVLKITSCLSLGTDGDPGTSCSGTFQPDGGGAPDPIAFTNTSHHVGATFPVQHLADGNSYRVGVYPTAVACAALVGSLLLFMAFVTLLCVFTTLALPRPAARLGSRLRGMPLRRMAGRVALGLGATLALLLLVTLIAWLRTS